MKNAIKILAIGSMIAITIMNLKRVEKLNNKIDLKVDKHRVIDQINSSPEDPKIIVSKQEGISSIHRDHLN